MTRRRRWRRARRKVPFQPFLPSFRRPRSDADAAYSSLLSCSALCPSSNRGEKRGFEIGNPYFQTIQLQELWGFSFRSIQGIFVCHSEFPRSPFLPLPHLQMLINPLSLSFLLLSQKSKRRFNPRERLAFNLRRIKQ